MVVQAKDGEDVVTVLPVTHSPPLDPTDALEIPRDTKRRLGLDEDRSWIVVAESNRFCWPGPDLRMARSGDASSVVYGSLPGAFFEQVRRAFLKKVQDARAPAIVMRTE